MNILLIEDNIDLAANIGDHLEASGHHVTFAYDGLGGIHLAVTHTYDVIVLDLMLPGMDGISLCRRLRSEARDTTPILMLTACDTLDDKLAGFEAGTDDYLTKPFSLKELAARVLALGRRRSTGSSTLKVGDLALDLGTLSAQRQGQTLELNRTCLRILTALMKASPRVVTRQELEHMLWGDQPPGTDALRSHIYHLRRIVDRPFDQTMIATVHGIGFQLRAPES